MHCAEWRSPEGPPGAAAGWDQILSRQLMQGIECAHKRPVRLKQIRCQHYKKGSKITGEKKTWLWRLNPF